MIKNDNKFYQLFKFIKIYKNGKQEEEREREKERKKEHIPPIHTETMFVISIFEISTK